MVCGEPQPERRTAEARIDTDGFFCNTAAVAAACNTYSLFVREDSLLPLAKLLLQRPACTQTGAIAPATRSATRHRSGALPTNRKSLHASADDVRSCICSLSHSQ